jgi:hypothetical protein
MARLGRHGWHTGDGAAIARRSGLPCGGNPRGASGGRVGPRFSPAARPSWQRIYYNFMRPTTSDAQLELGGATQALDYDLSRPMCACRTSCKAVTFAHDKMGGHLIALHASGMAHG